VSDEALIYKLSKNSYYGENRQIGSNTIKLKACVIVLFDPETMILGIIREAIL
jgi:hypothetical protein